MSDKFNIPSPKLAKLIIEWLREKLPSYVDKKTKQAVLSEFSKIKIPQDGVSVTDVKLDAGHLLFHLSNNVIIDVGDILLEGADGAQGVDGRDGIDGVGIINVELIDDALIVSLTDGRVINLGRVKGERGEQGVAGVNAEFKWQGTKLCFKDLNEEWQCVELKGEPGTFIETGGVGQPIITKLLTQNQGVNVNSRTQEIDFVGDVVVTKTGNTSVKVAINRRDMAWLVVDINTATLINTGYIANSVNQLELLLPLACEPGDKVRVLGYGVGGFKITQQASQLIHFGNKSTTIGISGELVSVQQKSVLEIICVDYNNFMIGSSIGNFILN